MPIEFVRLFHSLGRLGPYLGHTVRHTQRVEQVALLRIRLRAGRYFVVLVDEPLLHVMGIEEG